MTDFGAFDGKRGADEEVSYTGGSSTIGMDQLGSINLGNQSAQVEPVDQDPEDLMRQQRLRESDEARMREIQQKLVQEIEAKNERRSEGKKTLQTMLKNLDTLKGQKKKDKAEAAQSKAQNQGEWNTIVNNIALKNGEFLGTKDVSRMRDAIVNKAKDGK